MRSVKIILCGCGHVGRAFLRLIVERAPRIEARYGLHLAVSAVVGSRGAAIAETLPLSDLLDHLNRGGCLETLPDFGLMRVTGTEVIERCGADALVEVTPTDLVDGGIALQHVMTALERGMAIVSANKGPFVLRYEKIMDLARINGCSLNISAATAAALPTLDVGVHSLAGTEVIAVEGILNGTTNYILTAMRDRGFTFDQAIEEAQGMGIAETDPSNDIEGMDTAAKIVLIANRVLDQRFELAAVSTQGIAAITPADIQKASREGRVIKLIGTIERREQVTRLSVGPKSIGLNHPLARVDGTEKAISYLTDTMGRITVSGGKSSPTGAAAALLKDLINAFK